jgi:hypothetical protein
MSTWGRLAGGTLLNMEPIYVSGMYLDYLVVVILVVPSIRWWQRVVHRRKSSNKDIVTWKVLSVLSRLTLESKLLFWVDVAHRLLPLSLQWMTVVLSQALETRVAETVLRLGKWHRVTNWKLWRGNDLLETVAGQ